MGLTEQLGALAVLGRRGVAGPVRPDRLLGLGAAAVRWGPTLPAAVAVAAARWPHRVALIDDRRQVTYGELDRLSNRAANVLRAAVPAQGLPIGLLLRNSALMPIALAAVAKAGQDAVLLNTGSGAAQLEAIVDREGIRGIVADAEFADRIPPAIPHLTADDLLDTAARTRPPRSTRRGRIVILTSGTTGPPKGAPRDLGMRDGLVPAAGFLAAIPLRSGETTVVAAPLFHSWGLAHLSFGMLLGSTLVLSPRFDAGNTLRLLAEHEATALAAVPVMLRRLLDLPPAVRARYDLSALRVVAVSGSALHGRLAEAFQQAYGDVLYNLYGSTEVGFATVAGPKDLAQDPATAGRPLKGSTVRVVGDDGRPVAPGTEGRVFVGNTLTFTGYTAGGGDRERLDGLVATGDLGRIDGAGRLHLTGRDDDLIVSGGENVHPGPVEDLLTGHDGIAEAAVVGVEDERLGQRLAAYVVRTDDALTEDAVRDYVRSRLARHDVPRDVIFVESLPRNETGKVVKRDLAVQHR